MTADNPNTTSRKRGGKGTGQRAAAAMTDAMSHGDVKAAKAIGKTFLAIEVLEQNIKGERKDWATRINAAKATMRGAVEANDDGSDASVRSKLAGICTAWQELDEAKAGRKDALALLLEKRKELKSRLNQQIEGARQLGLFD